MLFEPEQGFLQCIIENPYTFPGGYEVFAIMEDGECVCYQCCMKEQETIKGANRGSGWKIAGLATTAEIDCQVTCANCNRVIREDWENEL
jgi:hypothetical protein